MIINRVLSIKEIVLVVHVTLVKTEVRWNEHNNPTKISEPSNHLEATSATVLRGLSFKMLLILTNKRTLKE